MLKRLGRGREKLFGDGRPLPLDRNTKVRLKMRALMMTRRTQKGLAYGPITAKAYTVFLTLLNGFHNAKSGKCFPGYARIAEDAGCAVSTVGEAIHMLERAGLLTWVNHLARIKVKDDYAGWRWRVIRTSNAYAFVDPAASATPPQERPRPAAARLRQVSKTEKPSGTESQEDSLADAPRRRDFSQDQTPLDAALARLGSKLQQRRPIMT